MLAAALSAKGYHTRVAHDAPGALRIAADFRPAVAFLDIGLPVMDGYELAASLRELPGLNYMKLIALTGYGLESDRRKVAARQGLTITWSSRSIFLPLIRSLPRRTRRPPRNGMRPRATTFILKPPSSRMRPAIHIPQVESSMTSEERAQLVEDIKRSNNLRHGVVERAELNEEFDILAAWEEVEKLDNSINERIRAARS